VTSLVRSAIRGEVDTLYASVHGGDPSKCVGNGVCGGVFKIADAGCSGNGCADSTTTRLDATPQPSNAEELLFTGQTLLCACGTDGFYEKSTGDPGLVQRNSNLAFDSSIGTSYAGIASGQGVEILGAYNPECEMVGQRQTCHTVYQSTDLGVTWTDLAFDIPTGNIDLTAAGTDVPWWEGSHKDSLIDGQQFTVSSIALTDDVPPVVLVAGHSGVWKTTDPDHQHWQPAVQGIGATTNDDVVADPRSPGYVYVGNTDWVAFASSSRLDPGTVVQTETPVSENPKKTAGFAVALDEQDLSSPSDVYLAAGLSGPTAQDVDVGGVYVNPDPTLDPWQSEGFAADQSCEGRLTPRVIGVAVGRSTQSDSPDVFAATDGCGLYRLRDGTWTHVATSTDLFATEDFLFNYAPISYPNSLGGVLYALDRKSGELWRSEDGGTTWGQGPIFAIPAGERDYNSGFMVADPNAQGSSVVWVSTNASDGLHELTCASQCEVAGNWDDRTDFAGIRNPGPIAIAPCVQPCTTEVYVATRAVAGDPTMARLYKSTPSGGFCRVVAGVSFYRGAANFPVQLAVTYSVSGTVTAYLTTIGDGTIVVSDPTGPDCT